MPERDPDIKGVAARAWVCRMEPRNPDHTASIGMWLLNGPSFHPFWRYWGIGIVSLEDIPGVKPPNLLYPEAEYEFMIAALDPDSDPNPDDQEPFAFMTPIDVVYQFHGVNSEQALGLADQAVRSMCAGTISPDQDYRQVWYETLGTKVGKLGGAGRGATE